MTFEQKRPASAGYMAYPNKRLSDNPYPDGSPEAAEWEDAWLEACADAREDYERASFCEPDE